MAAGAPEDVPAVSAQAGPLGGPKSRAPATSALQARFPERSIGKYPYQGCSNDYRSGPRAQEVGVAVGAAGAFCAGAASEACGLGGTWSGGTKLK